MPVSAGLGSGAGSTRTASSFPCPNAAGRADDPLESSLTHSDELAGRRTVHVHLTPEGDRMKFRTGIVALVAAGLTLTACTAAPDDASGRCIDPRSDRDRHPHGVADGRQPAPVGDRRGQRTGSAKKYPEVDVDVELQQWAGIQDKLTTSLAADSTPDVVEIGNTPDRQVRRRRPAGRPVGVRRRPEGRRACSPGLQPSGELNGVRYGIPYYGGVRVVVYNKGQFKDARRRRCRPRSTSSARPPRSSQKANADNSKYSAFYFPGKYWEGAVPFVWDAGGETRGEGWRHLDRHRWTPRSPSRA